MTAQGEEAKRIKANLDLQKKVGTGTVDEKKVERAQDVITFNKVDFAPVAKPHLDELSKAIKMSLVLKDIESKPESQKKILDSYMTPIMNIKANAATFNYSLVSNLAGTVLTFLEDVGKCDKKVIQIADLLYKTVLLIIARKMSGDGGAEGKALQAAFESVCQKALKKLHAAR